MAWSLPTQCWAQRGSVLANKRAEINAILRGKTLAGDDTQTFQAYFAEFFKQFAEPKPGPNTFPNLRKDLKNFLRNGKSGAAYNQLVQTALKEMRAIAASASNHPAARVNAILVLGDLNDQEDKEPKTLPAAYALLQFVVGSTKKFPDEMKIAAMVGLERAAAEGAVPADKRNELQSLMLKTLNETNPPPGGSSDGHTWMRRNAAQILAALGSPGPDGSVVAAYEKIVSDSRARTTLRCEMAECLGQLKYPRAAKVDYQSLANLLGHQTVELCKQELDAATTTTEFAAAVDKSRLQRMLAYVLYSSLHGFEGTDGRSGLWGAAAGTDSQKTIDGMRQKVKTLYNAVEQAEEIDVNEIKSQLAELEATLAPKPAPKNEPVVAENKSKPAEPAAQPNAARAAVEGKATGGK